MIGTAASPITALSAKLMTMNRNSRATIPQAPFCGRSSLILPTSHPQNDVALCRPISGPAGQLSPGEPPRLGCNGGVGALAQLRVLGRDRNPEAGADRRQRLRQETL